jgi:signal transduction histidine kinase
MPPFKLSLRTRILAVALLGVISCTVALYGLARILQLTTAARLERAREAVAVELRAMRHGVDCTPDQAGRSAVLGMRGACSVTPAAFDVPRPDLDDATRKALSEVSQAAMETRDVVVRDVDAPDPLVEVVGAAPTSAGSVAWIAYTTRPSGLIGTWRTIALSLSAATLLLVLTAVSTVVSVRRGARTLNASLEALKVDLDAPVPRPPVPELADLADHIAGLAGALARAQVEQERLGAELAQRDRLAALGRVVAGVAHEVRNPLASIKLRVDLGRMKPGTSPELASELLKVSDEITRLDRLVADLLVVAGRRRGPRAQAALGALVEKRAGLLAPWAGERGVHIHVSGDAPVTLDADAVARAVDNLVRNAVEASPEGGAVDVEVLDDERAARVRVLDGGAGVDDARRDELFEPFFTTKPDGTGLGLALSRAVAAAHGGTLTYAREGGRTCFELSFPHAPRAAAAAATT